MPKYVVFAVGEDKPGIVAGISQVLYEMNCNLEDSSMTILKDQFAIILIVDAPSEVSYEELDRRVGEVANRLSLFHIVKPLDGKDEKKGEYYTHCIIKVFGEDKTGIVYKVSKVLADRGVNISDLRTKITLGERKLYVMIIESEVPVGVTVQEIEEELSKVAQELDVDIVVEEVPMIRM